MKLLFENIDDLKELKIIKIKYFYIIFSYKNNEYLLHNNSESEIQELYFRQKINNNGNYILKFITCNKNTQNVLKYFLDFRKGQTYKQLNLNKFVFNLTKASFANSYYDEEIKQIAELRQELVNKKLFLLNEIDKINKQLQSLE